MAKNSIAGTTTIRGSATGKLLVQSNIAANPLPLHFSWTSTA